MRIQISSIYNKNNSTVNIYLIPGIIHNLIFHNNLMVIKAIANNISVVTVIYEKTKCKHYR